MGSGKVPRVVSEGEAIDLLEAHIERGMAFARALRARSTAPVYFDRELLVVTYQPKALRGTFDANATLSHPRSSTRA